jgi:hypothetical protein
MMRIATWNVQRPAPRQALKNEARLEKIREINADIWILTETHELIDLSLTHYGVATKPSARKPRPGEHCAAVWSRWPLLRRIDTGDPTEAVCVEVEHPDGELLVYGSIIPWDGCKGPDGNSPRWAEHYRHIEWHGRDWLRLRKEFPNHPLIAGGDYNQNRDGARWYGTRRGREMLSRALEDAGLRCVTEEDFVKTGKLQKRHTVDQLCMDVSLAEKVESVGAWERERPDGLQFSDHSGIFVELGITGHSVGRKRKGERGKSLSIGT